MRRGSLRSAQDPSTCAWAREYDCMTGDVLLVDDEPGVRFGIREFFRSHGYSVREAESCAAATMLFQHERFDAAIVDYVLPDGYAMSLLQQFREIDPEVPIIILTAHGSIELAVEALQR